MGLSFQIFRLSLIRSENRRVCSSLLISNQHLIIVMPESMISRSQAGQTLRNLSYCSSVQNPITRSIDRLGRILKRANLSTEGIDALRGDEGVPLEEGAGRRTTPSLFHRGQPATYPCCVVVPMTKFDEVVGYAVVSSDDLREGPFHRKARGEDAGPNSGDSLAAWHPIGSASA